MFRFAFACLAAVISCGCTSADESQHRPVFSPDGSALVFMRMAGETNDDWELYHALPDGSSARRLTHHPGWDGYAVWSPDGTKILFDREDDGRKHTALHNLATGEWSRLKAHAGWMAVNDWSGQPAKLLAFHEVEDRRDLYLLNEQGDTLRRLTNSPGFNEHDAHFSPDAARIAYASQPVDGSGSSLNVMTLSTGKSRVVHESQGRIYGLDWSSDGQSIAFTDNPPGGNDDDADIYVVELSSGGIQQLTHDPAWDHMPVWTPEGNILFTSYRTGSELMYTVDPGTGAVVEFVITPPPET